MKKRLVGLFLLAVQAAASEDVIRYRPVFSTVVDSDGKKFIALRAFEQQNIARYLLVDPLTLQTSVLPQSALKAIDEPSGPSLYKTALLRYTAKPLLLQNQGIVAAEKPLADSAFLTVDLCPSSRQFDQFFFNRLIAGSHGKPFPAGISVSGLWITKHRPAFKWLRQQNHQRRLAITWVNHSWRHRYIARLPAGKNFLLLPGTDVRQELLATEELLLAHNETPSVFVRFPGLIADAEVMATARELGLIPLGAEAWLAKGQKIRNGSVVLVHGNGNEPAGLKLLGPQQLAAWRWLALTRLVSGEKGWLTPEASGVEPSALYQKVDKSG